MARNTRTNYSGRDRLKHLSAMPLASASSGWIKASRILRWDEKPAEPMPLRMDPSQAFVSMGIYLFRDHADDSDREPCRRDDHVGDCLGYRDVGTSDTAHARCLYSWHVRCEWLHGVMHLAVGLRLLVWSGKMAVSRYFIGHTLGLC
jgi:hypothetical protein